MKRKNIYLFVVSMLLLSSCSTLHNSTYTKMSNLGNNRKPLLIQYPTMRTAVYNDNRAYEFKNDNSDILVIIIEGSGMLSVLGWEENNIFQKQGFWFYVLEEFKDECSILVLEKLNFELGVFYGYNVETRRNYIMKNLVDGYSKVIDSYLSENNYSKIVILGSSEGACVLPLVYKNIQHRDKISGLVSIAYGGLSRYEQIKILSGTQLEFNPIMREVFKNIDVFKNDINLYRDSIGDFLGLPYPWWNSFLDYSPYNDYKNINIPVLFIHGELDVTVPIESTKYIQENSPDKPFEYLIYPDADHHSFMRSRETFKDFQIRSREWLYKL